MDSHMSAKVLSSGSQKDMIARRKQESNCKADCCSRIMICERASKNGKHVATKETKETLALDNLND